jgi:hypothetical protein
MLNGEKIDIFPIKIGTGKDFTTPFQHHTGSSSQCNWDQKKKKKKWKDWEMRNKTAFVHNLVIYTEKSGAECGLSGQVLASQTQPPESKAHYHHWTSERIDQKTLLKCKRLFQGYRVQG